MAQKPHIWLHKTLRSAEDDCVFEDSGLNSLLNVLEGFAVWKTNLHDASKISELSLATFTSDKVLGIFVSESHRGIAAV